jgi:glycosyltransferase involved in cell wall biosynthesis
MAACWRALAARREVDLTVVGLAADSGPAPFDESLITGTSWRLLDDRERQDRNLVVDLVKQSRPDVVVVPGWAIPVFAKLRSARSLRSASFVLVMDTPRQETWRQAVNRLRLSRWVSGFQLVVVTGERSWQLARYLGVSEKRIRRGMYGVDTEFLGTAIQQRAALEEYWPRRFLFAGQYTNRKGLDVLLQAYRRYRQSVVDPWTLSCCGAGPLSEMVEASEGVSNEGFVQPNAMPGVMARHGAFVLPSRFDAWPLAVVEACAAGLPVICSEACGSAVELVRHLYNGYLVATGDVEMLAEGLLAMHVREQEAAQMGQRSVELARPYSAGLWADRWVEIVRDLGRAS